MGCLCVILEMEISRTDISYHQLVEQCLEKVVENGDLRSVQVNLSVKGIQYPADILLLFNAWKGHSLFLDHAIRHCRITGPRLYVGKLADEEESNLPQRHGAPSGTGPRRSRRSRDQPSRNRSVRRRHTIQHRMASATSRSQWIPAVRLFLALASTVPMDGTSRHPARATDLVTRDDIFLVFASLFVSSSPFSRL